jgi:hypothetical protein
VSFGTAVTGLFIVADDPPGRNNWIGCSILLDDISLALKEAGNDSIKDVKQSLIPDRYRRRFSTLGNVMAGSGPGRDGGWCVALQRSWVLDQPASQAIA